MDVDTYTDKMSTQPTIKSDFEEKLVVGGLTEDIRYRIVSIKNTKLITDKNPPKVGEAIYIGYDFKPYGPSGYGYEHLYLFIGRLEQDRPNYVRYFHNVNEMEEVLKDNKFELDKQWAKDKIIQLRMEMALISRDYEL